MGVRYSANILASCMLSSDGGKQVRKAYKIRNSTIIRLPQSAPRMFMIKEVYKKSKQLAFSFICIVPLLRRHSQYFDLPRIFDSEKESNTRLVVVAGREHRLWWKMEK